MFGRRELRPLRERAETYANAPGLPWGWRQAYLDLVLAADRLDAMMARQLHDDATALGACPPGATVPRLCGFCREPVNPSSPVACCERAAAWIDSRLRLPPDYHGGAAQ